jgi:rubrerythrin
MAVDLAPLHERLHQLTTLAKTETQMTESIASILAVLFQFSRQLSASLTKLQKQFSPNPPHDFENFTSSARLSGTIQLMRTGAAFSSFFRIFLSTSDSPELYGFFPLIHGHFDELLATRVPVLFGNCPFARTEFVYSEETPDPPPRCLAEELFGGFAFPDSSFVPTDRSLAYVQNHSDWAKGSTSMVQMFSDTARTHHELAILIVELTNAALLASDYVSFPRFDIIRDMAAYQNYVAQSTRQLPMVRTELAELSHSVTELFQGLSGVNEAFSESYYLSKIDLMQLVALSRDNTTFRITSDRLTFLKRIFDSVPALRLPQSFRAVSYVHHMYTKYADISKTQDFETIGQLIRDMTEITIQSREMLMGELAEMARIRKQLEMTALEWAGRPRQPVTDDPGAAVGDLRTAVAEAAEESVQSESRFTTQLAEAAHSAVATVVDPTELFPVRVESMLDAVGEKTSAWLWVARRREAQHAEQERHTEKIRELTKRADELRVKAQEARATLDATRASVVLCRGCRRRMRDTWLPCGHAVCRSCIAERRTCPVCETEFDPEETRTVKWS